MAFLIDQLNNSGLFAQSAYSAGIATCDSDGNIITATYLSSVDLTPYQTTAGMTAYATTGDVTNKLDTTAFSDVSGTFLTAHQSLDGYATTAWVDSQGYLTAHQPISADEWNNVYDTVNVYSGSWTGSETSPTASVDSNGSIDIVSSNNTVYFDVNGTWFNNAVNSAVDVPTGVMVESACQYNAVNEISAYNGSAIAQYGAEKQWLQHDDTIVHISNSAQYAFGCNVSALQRLMGIDETVLWEGSANNGTLNFTDPLTSFKEFKFYVDIPERGTNKVLTFYDAVNTVTPGFIQLTTTTMTNGSVVNDWWQGVYNLNATLNTATYKSMTIYANGQYYKQCSTTACGTNASKLVIKKVIGIGRKA